MFWVRVHLVLLAALLLGLAWHARALPYFPIEVSRAASATALNRRLFPAGVLLLAGTLLLLGAPVAGRKPRHYGLAWVGLLASAWFDDRQHVVLHFVAVALMTLGLWHALGPWQVGARRRFVAALALYGARVALKLLAVGLWETHSWNPILAAARTLQIMDHGAVACNEPATLLVFRLCGALQWLVLGVLLTCLE